MIFHVISCTKGIELFFHRQTYTCLSFEIMVLQNRLLACYSGFPLKTKTSKVKQERHVVLQWFYLLIYFKTRNFTHIILLSFYIL